MKKDVVEKIAALMTAAFGLVAALAWNEAIKSLFAEGGALYFMASGGVWLYAVVVTIIAVFAILWIAKVAEKANQVFLFFFIILILYLSVKGVKDSVTQRNYAMLQNMKMENRQKNITMYGVVNIVEKNLTVKKVVYFMKMSIAP